MTSFTLERPSVFPDGTVVKAYAASNWPDRSAASGAPRGASAAEATVAAGKVSLEGLSKEVDYFAVAEVGGEYRYIGIRVGVSSAPVTRAQIEAELVPFVNVKAFGAKGDGETNDAAAITEAVAALPANGGTVVFPQGVYLTNSTIEITKPSVKFEGVGWDQETLTAGSCLKANAVLTDALKIAATASTFQMQAMWVDGNAKATNVVNVEALNVQIGNSQIRRPATNGFGILGNGPSMWLTNVRFNGANQAGTTGIRLNNTDATVTGCKPVNCVTGIEITKEASGAILTANHITPGGTIGKNPIWISGNASNVTISGNRFDNTLGGAPIHIDLAANANSISVVGNLSYMTTLENEKFPFVGVDTSAGNVYGLTIIGNTVRSATSHLHLALVAAQKKDGTAATNRTRIKTMGTIATGNAIYAKEAYGAESEPLVKNNTFSANGTEWAAA